MPTVGKKRNILPDTTLTAPKQEAGNQSNLKIQEDEIFSKAPPAKKEDPINLEIEAPAPVQEAPKAEPPKKRGPGRPKMSEERREEVRKERAARLVAGRAKALETRRKNAIARKEKALQEAKAKIAQPADPTASAGQRLASPPPQPKQELPPGFAGAKQNMAQLVAEQKQAKQEFDYDRVVNAVWDKMASYNQNISDQALLQYQENIRKEERARAQAALKSEYEKNNKQKAQIQNMNNSVSLLAGQPRYGNSNHRVFGRRPRNAGQGVPRSAGANPYDVCFN